MNCMDNLDHYLQDDLPFKDATLVRDLISADGPLVTLYRAASGAPLLAVWMDQDDVTTRLYVLPLTKTQMWDYLRRRVSLLDLIRVCDPFLVDESLSGGTKMYRTGIPLECLPGEGSLLPWTDYLNASSHYARYAMDADYLRMRK